METVNPTWYQRSDIWCYPSCQTDLLLRIVLHDIRWILTTDFLLFHQQDLSGAHIALMCSHRRYCFNENKSGVYKVPTIWYFSLSPFFFKSSPLDIASPSIFSHVISSPQPWYSLLLSTTWWSSSTVSITSPLPRGGIKNFIQPWNKLLGMCTWEVMWWTKNEN